MNPMIFITIAAQLAMPIDDPSASICVGAKHCPARHAAWTELKPDADGQYMVFDGGRWRWHSLLELGDRD